MTTLDHHALVGLQLILSLGQLAPMMLFIIVESALWRIIIGIIWGGMITAFCAALIGAILTGVQP
jgi:hypothetical protein